MRTAIYIDGMNFYYGAVKDTDYRWLDLKRMCESILRPDNKIISIVYCTAKIKSKSTNPQAPMRQATYLKAIEAYTPELKVIDGYFLEHRKKYRPVDTNLGEFVEVFHTEEKGSDVNLAVNMVNDAHKGQYDCAVVVSNDGDLAEAMRIVNIECGKVVGLFTPWKRRVSKHLMKYSSFQREIRKATLENSQLPNPIPGTNIYKPQDW